MRIRRLVAARIFVVLTFVFSICTNAAGVLARDVDDGTSASRAPQSRVPNAQEPSLTEGPLTAARQRRRLFTVVPRVGLQLGTWAGTLHSKVRDRYSARSFESDASGNVGAVFGAEALFRLRFGLRLGGGVLVMPALSFQYDSSSDRPERTFTAGTVIRIPAVLEWEFFLTDRFSIVPGIIPSALILLRGEQAKNRPGYLCFLGECESEDIGSGVAVEGELGVMWWVGSQALRADVRVGYESLQTASADGEGVVETLSGARMTWWLAFEI